MSTVIDYFCLIQTNLAQHAKLRQIRNKLATTRRHVPRPHRLSVENSIHTADKANPRQISHDIKKLAVASRTSFAKQNSSRQRIAMICTNNNNTHTYQSIFMSFRQATRSCTQNKTRAQRSRTRRPIVGVASAPATARHIRGRSSMCCIVWRDRVAQRKRISEGRIKCRQVPFYATFVKSGRQRFRTNGQRT